MLPDSQSCREPSDKKLIKPANVCFSPIVQKTKMNIKLGPVKECETKGGFDAAVTAYAGLARYCMCQEMIEKKIKTPQDIKGFMGTMTKWIKTKTIHGKLFEASTHLLLAAIPVQLLIYADLRSLNVIMMELDLKSNHKKESLKYLAEAMYEKPDKPIPEAIQQLMDLNDLNTIRKKSGTGCILFISRVIAACNAVGLDKFDDDKLRAKLAKAATVILDEISETAAMMGKGAKRKRNEHEESSPGEDDESLWHSHFEMKLEQMAMKLEHAVMKSGPEVSELREEVSELREEVSELNEENSERKEEISELQEEITKLKRENSELKQELSEIKNAQILAESPLSDT